MLKTNKEILKEAELALAKKWGRPILVGLSYFLLIFLIELIQIYIFTNPKSITKYLFQIAINLIITGPLWLGFSKYYLEVARRENPAYEIMYIGFLDFKRAFITYLLSSVYIILRLLLLIIPGIIAMFDYGLVFFILSDDSEISSNDAILKSKKMMYGHKKQLFYMSLTFLGLFIVSIFTLFIGLLWLLPYTYVSYSIFYVDVKKQYEAEKLIIE